MISDQKGGSYVVHRCGRPGGDTALTGSREWTHFPNVKSEGKKGKGRSGKSAPQAHIFLEEKNFFAGEAGMDIRKG